MSSELNPYGPDPCSHTSRGRMPSQHPEPSCPNEERYRALLANIPDVLWTIDSQFRFTFISSNIERISGFSLEEIHQSGARLYLDCVHPEDRTRVIEGLRALFEHGRPYDIECRVRRKPGDWIWVHDRAYSTYEKGGVRYADGILTEITARRQAEEKLRKTEEQYRTLFQGISDAVLLVAINPDRSLGRFLEVNDIACERLGYSREELLRMTPQNIDELGQAIPLPSSLVGNGPIVFETVQITKEGRKIPVEISARLMEFQGRPAGLGLARDITRRKQAEQMLRESEERLRSLIESTQDWVWEVDVQGRYTYCSPRITNLLGYGPEEVLGRTPFDFMDPEEAARCRAAFVSIVRERAPIRNLANTNLHKNGHPVILESNGLAILDENGQLTGYRGIDRDITERRLAERELQRAKEAAEAANRAKSEFLANMSHEIRTPMNGILGMADIMLETELTAQQRDYLGIVKDSAESLLTILNDILDLSKIEAGKLDFESAPFDLRAALGPTIRALTLSAQRKSLQLNYFVAPNIPRVLVGDPGRLRQILLNLVGNAVKFTERGRVTVRLEQDSADREYVWLRLSVADTGVGIPSSRLEAIFDPFAQADNSTTRRYGGTGLGLTIARELTEMMHGRLTVESTVDVGSTFHCTLRLQLADPLQTAAILNPVPSPISAAARCNPAACGPILVADDNPVNQSIAAALLRRQGYQVELALNGREAVETVRGKPVTAVLMDVQMPEMDGFEATAAIRRLEAGTGTHVPIIAMTAHAMKGDRERCLDAGMDGYVSKPVHAHELLALLENLISRA
ncbi:MAG TPA: PAS domain S-box protein [Bryobacteraceae bacterium]|nr:PAS domain S-box protein [Bryobacteraceae bacterium]